MADVHDVRPPVSSPTDIRHVPIEVEVRGLAGRETVFAPAGPGAVRGAVEKALSRLRIDIFER